MEEDFRKTRFFGEISLSFVSLLRRFKMANNENVCMSQPIIDKVGILTHPLAGNYGGMLQAYALHTVLKRLGLSPFILDRDLARQQGKRERLRDIWYFVKRILMPVEPECRLPFFVERYVGMSFHRLKNAELNIVHLNKLESFRKHNRIRWVVGSDQVWRGIYANWICTLPFFFLDFVKQYERVESIAYAASFGSDKWEGLSQETIACKRLIKDFKAVSVREFSGIDICRKVFDIEAEQMPDPTLLLSASDYGCLIAADNYIGQPRRFLAAYILDFSEEIQSYLSDVADSRGLSLCNLMTVGWAKKIKERFPKSVSQWLRGIRDCDCLVTDSFHGCVFAIIFNKPFVCIGNKKRGAARFESLLGYFGLRDRYLKDVDVSITIRLLETPIDWASVDLVIKHERERAFQFLEDNLLK